MAGLSSQNRSRRTANAQSLRLVLPALSWLLLRVTGA